MKARKGITIVGGVAMAALIGLSDCAAAKPNAEQLPVVAAAKQKVPPVKRALGPDSPLVFSETVATREWERSVYPLGNGRLGCAAFGDPQKERIRFNEDSLWVGNEDCTGGYQPFGDVYVETPHAEYSDYRRELDVSRAVQTITYRSGGRKERLAEG